MNLKIFNKMSRGRVKAKELATHLSDLPLFGVEAEDVTDFLDEEFEERFREFKKKEEASDCVTIGLYSIVFGTIMLFSGMFMGGTVRK